jgi:rfaE bifunctional protein nucleotidyltransferase chain/domain/rfaE bifunctional protein kinase chain/domain
VTPPGPLVVVGDALLDRDVTGTASRLCPDAPALVLDDAVETRRPGGAALAALLAARAGAQVILVAPVGTDPASDALTELLDGEITLAAVPLRGPLPEKTRFRAAGTTLLRADGPAGRPGPTSQAAVDAVAGAGALLVSDYGRGTAGDPRLRAALADRARRVPLIWDPHPRGPAPVPGTRLATPNQTEAAKAAALPAPAAARPVQAATAAALRLLARWPVDAVAVTLGGRGVLLAHGGPAPLIVPVGPLEVTDTCGAGDRFAAAAAAALRDGALVSEAVTGAAAAATAFLAGGGVARLAPGGRAAARGGTPRAGEGAGPGSITGALALADRVRGAGGTVVAAGGCFDVLHAGHVSMLEAARSLGDCLIVCMNSDESVRRLKGDGRPLNPAADRAAVLSALQWVDGVLVFDEDTPAAALARLRPGLWVKGGDYHGRDLPEAALLSAWGGQAVTVPYLAWRSTSRLHAAGAAAGRHRS